MLNQHRPAVRAVVFVSLACGLALALGCGPTQEAACGPGTCMGCCDSAGVCQTGVIDNQCGRQGAACEACAAGTACNLGICAAPQGCAGCFEDGVCRSGDTNAACGGNGESCDECGSNEICVNRVCQKTCKDLNAQCASDGECCDGRCSLLGFCSMPLPDGGTDGGEEGDGGFIDVDGGTDGGTPGGDGGVDGGTDGGMLMCGDPCKEQSGPMPATCNPCASQICGVYPSCCTTAWDSTCATIAGFLCTGCGTGFDAGFPNLDGGFPGFDGGIPGFDGGIPGFDGGIPGFDGGIPGFDGGFP